MKTRMWVFALAAVLAVALFGAGMATPASATGSNVHCVRYGETLYGIASAYGTTAYAIAYNNGLGNPNYIVAGTCLRIPAGSYGYTGGYTGGTNYGYTGGYNYNNYNYKPNYGYTGGYNYNNWNYKPNYGYTGGYNYNNWNYKKPNYGYTGGYNYNNYNYKPTYPTYGKK